MKKLSAMLLAVLLLAAVMPQTAFGSSPVPAAQTARTTLLDLTNQTTSVSNSAEGWSFNPTGYNGNPQLTLNSYGTASQHSAPISLPANSRVVVNGSCYIDNVYMGEPYSVLAGLPNGYLLIEGTGTLNLYADQYNGRCIDIPGGGYNEAWELLYINDITVNCYGRQPNMYTAFANEAMIFSITSIYITNAVINTYNGGCGIRAYGHTPIGGVSEETASEIVIDSSDINIVIDAVDNVWNYAQGIRTTFGKIRITGDSNVNINAGSCSIYSYLSFTIEGGNVNIRSTPLSYGVGIYAIVYCGSLRLMNGMGQVYFGTTRYPNTNIVWSEERSDPVCESGVTFDIGSYTNMEFVSGPDPDNNDLPAIKAHGSGETPPPPVLMGDVDGNGVVDMQDALMVLRYSMGLISAMPVMAAADVNSSGQIEMNDALMILRAAMGLISI